MPARRIHAADRPTAERQRRGFTLIELLMVMVMMAVIAATAVPAISRLSGQRQRSAARDLYADIVFARQNAVATGRRTWVVFSTANQTWSLFIETAGAPGRSNRVQMTDPATNNLFLTRLNNGPYAGVTLTSVNIDGNPEIAFDWLGKPYNQGETDLAANGVITLSGGRTITITPGTGYAQVSGL
ncbi:MAG: GspH/FimT family pseudopilin [Phycisphaerales bacterium]|nr:GspH/FimT family pseudopilin [Phycisphaerales bacterium]